MVAIARGLMAAPRLLLLDEPSLGLSPKVTEEVFARIQDIGKRGVTVLIVEQNVVDGLHISDRGYVLEHGRVTLQGQAKDLLHDDRIRAAYLGL
jgi:branched-chain amino acid transport system ATP-binding protein